MVLMRIGFPPPEVPRTKRSATICLNVGTNPPTLVTRITCTPVCDQRTCDLGAFESLECAVHSRPCSRPHTRSQWGFGPRGSHAFIGFIIDPDDMHHFSKGQSQAGEVGRRCSPIQSSMGSPFATSGIVVSLVYDLQQESARLHHFAVCVPSSYFNAIGGPLRPLHGGRPGWTMRHLQPPAQMSSGRTWEFLGEIECWGDDNGYLFDNSALKNTLPARTFSQPRLLPDSSAAATQKNKTPLSMSAGMSWPSISKSK